MSWGVRKFSGGRQWYRTDRWQRLRRRVLSEQPFCAMREKRERCRLVATEVDHIKPHRGDRRLFFDRANLQPMCRSCHAQKTWNFRDEDIAKIMDGVYKSGAKVQPVAAQDHHTGAGAEQ